MDHTLFSHSLLVDFFAHIELASPCKVTKGGLNTVIFNQDHFVAISSIFDFLAMLS